MSRLDKVNQQLRREISTIIQRELSDPRLEFVTITHADVSPDLHNARISFTVLGDSTQAKAAREGLDRARGMIRKLLGKHLTMRYTPELRFQYDESTEIITRIDETLEEIHNEHKKNHTDHPEE